MTTVWGFLPVFIRIGNDKPGTQRAMFIFLAENHRYSTLMHELFHVKQWYVSVAIFSMVYFPIYIFANKLWLLLPTLLFLYWHVSKLGSFIRETAAFGESLRHEDAEMFDVRLDSIVAALSGPKYNLGRSPRKIRERIISRYEDGRLF